MYKAFTVEHNLALNSLHNITHNNSETKQKIESLLTIIDSLQLADVPKLRENVKQLLVSMSDRNCDDSHNISNEDENGNNRNQIYVADDTSSNNDTNGLGYSNINKEIIETIDNNNSDIKYDSVSNESNIVDVYIATIPRHHDGRNNDTTLNDTNISTCNNNIILMNELSSALQLISFTERINKFDDDDDNNNNDNSYDNNVNDYDTNEINLNMNGIKRELPLQLNANVTLDLQRRLLELNQTNTCNNIVQEQ